MRKIYVVGPSTGYANWMQGTLVKTMEEADLVVFTGGEDVTPALYHERRHPTTGNNPARDAREIREYVKAQTLEKYCIGICRGSQFITVMNSGRLVQDQSQPGSVHPMYTFTGQIVKVTSSHHQASFPFELPDENYQVLGWTENQCGRHEDGEENEMNPPVEVEMIVYPKSRSLGIQSHPEWQDLDGPSVAYFRDILTDFLNDKLFNNEQATQKAEATA